MGSVILGHVKLKEKEKEVCFLNLFQKSRIICANLKAYLLMTCEKSLASEYHKDGNSDGNCSSRNLKPGLQTSVR